MKESFPRDLVGRTEDICAEKPHIILRGLAAGPGYSQLSGEYLDDLNKAVELIGQDPDVAARLYEQRMAELTQLNGPQV